MADIKVLSMSNPCHVLRKLNTIFGSSYVLHILPSVQTGGNCYMGFTGERYQLCGKQKIKLGVDHFQMPFFARLPLTHWNLNIPLFFVFQIF